MKSPKLALIGGVVLVVTLLVALLVPHSDDLTFWVALVCVAAAQVTWIIGMAVSPDLLPRGDYLVSFPAKVAVAAWVVATMALLVISGVLSMTLLIILELLAAAAALIVVVLVSMNVDHHNAASEAFQAGQGERFTPREGGF